jgi:hypothetical protein
VLPELDAFFLVGEREQTGEGEGAVGVAGGVECGDVVDGIAVCRVRFQDSVGTSDSSDP